MAEKNFLEDGGKIEQGITLPKHRPWWIFGLLVVIVALLAGAAWYYNKTKRQSNLSTAITTFAQCRDAGGIILESLPEQCTFQGKSFTNLEQQAPEPPSQDQPQTEEPKLASYTDTANGFTIQYPADFTQSEKEIVTPYTNTAVEVTSQAFSHTIALQHCTLKGDCAPTTTDISVALSVVNSTMAKIEASKIKSELTNLTAGTNKFRTFTQGVEGEGIYYYFIALPNGKTLMISRTYIDETVLGDYKDAKDFIKKVDQDKLAEQILASLSFAGAPKTITNTTYQYTFSYGSDFQISKEGEVGPGLPAQEYFAGAGSPIDSVYLKKETFPKTNFNGGLLTVAVSPSTKTEAECKKFAVEGGATPGSLNSIKLINGLSWFMGSTTGAAAGTQYKTTIYHILHGGSCVEISTTAAIPNIANYEGTVTAVDEKAIQAKFDSVINTFKFAK